MIKVFGSPFSPFVRKVYLVAAFKGIEFEAEAANPRDPSAEFAACSPFRKMPAIQDEDYTLADSTAIAAYLDAKYPEPTLFPKDPRALGRAVWWEEFADTIVMPSSGKVVFNRFVAPRFLGIEGDESIAAEGEAELGPKFDYLDSQCGDGWLAGTEFGIADISVATGLKTLGYVGVALDPARHPRASAWYDRVKARREWQEVAAREAQMLGQPA